MNEWHEKHVENMDRHTVDCENDRVLTEWYVEADPNNSANSEYKCVALQTPHLLADYS